MRHIVYFIFSFIVCCIVASCNTGSRNVSDETSAWLEKARTYEAQGDAANAMICYLNALDVMEERQDTVLKVSAYTRLGNLRYKYGMYVTAAVHHPEGYDITLRLNDE